tara:strand:- start:155 stop:514 length:360 start_codon:yes stop_codon:yes gene_type:complete
MKKILVSTLTLLIMSASSIDAQNRTKRHYYHNSSHHSNSSHTHTYRPNTAADVLLPMIIGGLVYSIVHGDNVESERPCPYVERYWVKGYWKRGPLGLRWWWVEGYWQERVVQCNTYYYR